MENIPPGGVWAKFLTDSNLRTHVRKVSTDPKKIKNYHPAASRERGTGHIRDRKAQCLQSCLPGSSAASSSTLSSSSPAAAPFFFRFIRFICCFELSFSSTRVKALVPMFTGVSTVEAGLCLSCLTWTWTQATCHGQVQEWPPLRGWPAVQRTSKPSRALQQDDRFLRVINPPDIPLTRTKL